MARSIEFSRWRAWLTLVVVLLAGARAVVAQTATLTTTTTSLNASGGTVTLTATFSFPGKTLSQLGWTVVVPGGWAYVSSTGPDLPDVRPRVGDTVSEFQPFGWAYLDPTGLVDSAQFSTTVSYPAGLSGTQTIQASVNYKLPTASAQQVATAPSVAFSLAAGAVTITSQPASRTVTAGNSVSFSVTATGSGLTYQWRKNSTAIVSATASTLNLTAVTAADTGAYDVIVSGGGASVVSAQATLTVNPAQSPPVISQQPASVSATPGGTATFSVTASGAPAPSYQWRRNGTAIPGATGATLVLANVQSDNAGTYDVVVTNSAGSVTSTSATLVVSAVAVAPSVSGQPRAASAVVGGAATFSVTASGTAPLTYQWRKNDTDVAGATNASLALTKIQSGDAGSYSVVVRNSAGSVISAAATLTVTAASSPPAITAQPVAQSANVGAAVAFSVTTTGSPSPAYQWRKGGVAITGATDATLAIANAQTTDAGSYDVVVSNSAGSVTSTAAALTVTAVPAAASRLVNASVRCAAGSGDQTLIVGFILRGTGPRQLLLRGIGPTLADFGVTGALADPRLRLFNADGAVVTENDDWGGASSLSTAFAQAGAFALPTASKDAALLIPLAPGNYTAHVTSAGASGIALVEAYDADAGPPTARLANLSVRTQVGSGDNALVVGFVIAGTASKELLVRGIGPGLAPFGVTGTLTDPQLRLFDSQGKVVQQNDDWGGTATLTGAFVQVAAFNLPVDSKDAALIARLAPGAYTVEVSGPSATPGVGLVELYELP